MGSYFTGAYFATAFDLSSFGGGTGAFLASGAFAASGFTLSTDLFYYLLILNNILFNAKDLFNLKFIYIFIYFIAYKLLKFITVNIQININIYIYILLLYN